MRSRMRGNQEEKDLSSQESIDEKSTSESESSLSGLSTNSESSIKEPAFFEEPKELFTYERLKQRLIIEGKPILGSRYGDFAAGRIPNSVFISFGYKDNETEINVGWKAHISIDDSDKENLAKAWDLVKDVIIDEKLVSKVVVPDANFYNDPVQCGKQITIYCHMTPAKDWEDIFHRIENALCVEDIKASTFSPSDKPLPGSAFLSYRNDDNGNGNYIASDHDYNPASHDDIFDNIQIQPRGVRFR